MTHSLLLPHPSSSPAERGAFFRTGPGLPQATLHRLAHGAGRPPSEVYREIGRRVAERDDLAPRLPFPEPEG